MINSNSWLENTHEPLNQAFDMAIKALEQQPTIPDNATNGDMIKAIFPNLEFYNAMPFTDGRWETINLDTENHVRAIYKPTRLRVYADWWDAPYKGVEND